jgi:threonine dehydrogenase-like Zn-dependent dehydrogenase
MRGGWWVTGSLDGERGLALVVRRPGDVVLEQRGVPLAGPGEVLIRPEVVGLCGTDLDIVAGRIDPAYIRYPLVLGHEWSGTVAERPGPGADAPAGEGLAAGTRVVGEGIVPCGHCPRCRAGQTNLCLTYEELGFTRDGAAAQFVVVQRSLVHPLAPAAGAEDAALAEPASVVYRGLAGAGIAPGWRALVVGDGTVALLAVRLLGLWSPAETVMLGQREGQAALAAQAGAARFETDSRAVGTGYDLVVEAAGSTDAVLTALAAARRGGTVVLLGLPPHGATAAVPVDDVVNNDLIIRGSFGYTSAAWREVVTLLNAGLLELSFLVTHRFPLTEWEAALDTLREPVSPRGKVMLTVGST